MSSDALVTDPALLSVLQAAANAREQSLAILDLLEQHHAAPIPEDPTEQLLALSKQQKTLNAHLAQLRALNRKAVLSVRRTKQETTEARQEIDSLHLQLQNLYYEQKHLKGEIQACGDYQHKYQQLTMPAQEEFIEAHPQHADQTDHELTIARIEDEQAARQTLYDEAEGLRKRRDAVQKETNAKKEELAKLDADIEKWLGGEANIRKTIDAHLAKSTEIQAQ